MFGRKTVRNTEAMVMNPPAMPQAQRVTTTAPNPWPVVIVVGVIALPIFGYLLWWSAVYVLQRAGFGRDAERALAILAAIIIGSFPILWIVKWFAGSLLTGWYEHRERMLEINNEALRYRTMTAQQPIPSSRLTDEDKRFARVIQAVMFTTYDQLARNGGEFAGVWRPWSRRSVMATELTDGSTPTEGEAARVRDWLEKYEIIIGNQVNVGKYPNLESVINLLRQLYDVPIQVNPSLPPRSNEGYIHI
jgi:hypothetical protein